ncbi:hypothetical protein HYY74_03875 [Candidatus Woesearchaeota archaeon]|nr:hypothetical protein [Candidatus Woesearchaeota archaeon]
MKLNVNKIASSTKNVNLPGIVEISGKVEAEEGNLIAVKALGENPNYGDLELCSGRMSKIIEGDIIVGVLGERRAQKGFYGKVPKGIKVGDVLNILSMGGVIGKALSAHPDLGNPISVEVLGSPLVFEAFNERVGRPANIRKNAIPPRKNLDHSAPLVVFSASCMDAGKTTAACELIKGLASKGYRVAGVKLTGVSLMRDTLAMKDYGAARTLDFNDAGMVSTTSKPMSNYAKGLLTELNKDGVDCIVIELGDGILGEYGVQSILKDKDISRFVKAHIVCANDPVAAWGAKKLFEEFGLGIAAICGRVTDTEVGIEFIEKKLNIPAANMLKAPEKVVNIVEKKVFSK